MAKRLALIVALAIVIVVAGVLFLSGTGYLRGNTQVHSSGRSYQVGTRSGEKVPSTDQLAVYVEGSDPLASALLRELPRPLVEDMPYNAVARLTTLPEKVNAAVLVVEPEIGELAWAGVYARSSITCTVSYASDGETTWRREERPIVVGAADPLLRSRIEVTLEDTTRGFVPRRAYVDHLARHLADAVAEALAHELGIAESEQSKREPQIRGRSPSP